MAIGRGPGMRISLSNGEPKLKMDCRTAWMCFRLLYVCPSHLRLFRHFRYASLYTLTREDYDPLSPCRLRGNLFVLKCHLDFLFLSILGLGWHDGAMFLNFDTWLPHNSHQVSSHPAPTRITPWPLCSRALNRVFNFKYFFAFVHLYMLVNHLIHWATVRRNYVEKILPPLVNTSD